MELLLKIAMPVVTIISLVIALLSYYMPRNRKKLQYQTASVRYFEEDDYTLPSEVEMSFRGKRVTRLAKSMLIVWSGGTDVLRGEDIVKQDPLTIKLKGTGKILSYSIVGVTSQGNRVLANKRTDSQSDILLTYDYLNPGDGAVIQVMHDSKQRDLFLVGASKGLSGGPQNLGAAMHHDFEVPWIQRILRLQRMILLVMFGFALAILLWGICRTIPLLLDDYSWIPRSANWLFGEKGENSETVLTLVAGMVWLWFPVSEIAKTRRRFPKPLERFLKEPEGAS